MLPYDQALARLAAMLDERGFDAEQPDVALAVRTFREFAAEPVAAADDAILFQTGVYNFSGEPTFQLDFTRQFEFEVDGEYEGMQQLHMLFHFAPTPALAALVTSAWSSDSPSLDEFFARVEAMPEFRTPVTQCRPLRFELFQEDV